MADSPVTPVAVGDDELLYRAVRAGFVRRMGDGELRISSQAFADRMMRPSVDRAPLRNFDPSLTRFNPSDGVVSVTARDVRSINATRNDANGNPVQEYVADVEPVPLPDNPAHAEIFGRPGFDNDKVFRRVCEALTRVIRWEIELSAE
jgi:hypothetical protein